MKTTGLLALLASLSSVGLAGELPVAGLLQQIPVMSDGIHVTARPVYILTRQKLAAPTVFSGLQDGGGTLRVLCCYQVVDIAPVDLKAQLQKYAGDEDFVMHIRAVKGYRYAYFAHAVADKRMWTPLMRAVMNTTTDPNDGSPFTAPVISARFDKDSVPPTFKVGTAITLRTRYDDAGDTHYSFKIGNETTVFSEPGFAH